MHRWGRLETPFILAHYETMNMAGVEEPLRSQPTRERFALVEPTIEPGTYLLDIHFCMLQPHELARAQGFPADYVFTGKRDEIVMQIRNAVPPNTARALLYEALA